MDSDEHKIKSKRKVLWQKFHSEVSLNGFKYLFSQRGLPRILWIVGFVCALLFSAYLNLSCIREFSMSKSYSRYEKVVLKEINFPTVTICSLNFVLTSKLKHLELNESLDEVRSYFDSFDPSYQHFSHHLIEKIAIHLQRRNVTSVEDLVNKTDITIFEMLEKVWNKQPPCSYYGKECFPNDFKFTGTRMNFMPRCHQFNWYAKGKEPLKVTRKGIGNNFQFYGNLHIDDLFYTPFNMAGLLVMIHPYGTPSFKADSTYNFFATPGRMNILQLKLKKTKLLPPPYDAKCGQVNMKILKHYPYSKAACETDCVLQNVYEICGCVDFTLKDFVENIPICNISDQVCYMRELHRYDKIAKCKCPQSCSFDSYLVQTSHVMLGSDAVIEQYIKDPEWNKSYEEAENYIKKNMIGIGIYFADLVARKEVMTPTVNWSNLLGNVGGNIGLCVGFSIITLYEFLLFIWKFISIGLPHRSKQYDLVQDNIAVKESYTRLT